jgi:hypothetical protein
MAVGYVNGLLMAILRPALDGLVLPSAPDTPALVGADRVGTKLPADVLKVLPFITARATPGGTTKGPKLDTRFGVPIQIDAFHTTARAAHDLADRALWALHDARSRQLVTADGHINRITSVTGPFEFIDAQAPDGLSRWVVTASLTARPPV